MTTPLVSVVMPVYNGERYVKNAIDSILSQSFTELELIIINDGSTDSTTSLLKDVSDPRVRLFQQPNCGLAATLNRGIGLARGVYIARQDHDDISLRDRISKQVSFMRSKPECVLLGTAAEIWIDDAPSGRFHDHPTDNETLQFDLLFNNPFVHSSIMMRKEVVMRIGGYCTDSTRQPPEDYELWSRMAREGQVANLRDRLVVYREVPNSISRSKANSILNGVVNISSENLAIACGRNSPTTDTLNLAALTHSAVNRLSENLNLGEMVAVIRIAANSINAGAPSPLLLDRVNNTVNNIEYQYFKYGLPTSEFDLLFLKLKYYFFKSIAKIYTDKSI
jgi:glycosyltransferase involved in cell wall biosynthesis